MQKVTFHEALAQILVEDPRFTIEAYGFIRESLDFTIKHFEKPVDGPGRHAELLEGIRKFALKEYGPLAKTVFERWGVSQTKDFGHLVFNLVGKGVLGKTEEDNLEDFSNGYDFEKAFRDPFRPRNREKTSAQPAQDQPAEPAVE